jgi:hypothetical protein
MDMRTMSDPAISAFRHISAKRREEFLKKGYRGRYFFPHKTYYIPKCGPDGFKLAKRVCNVSEPDKLWEIVLFAVSPIVDEFPRELFFDDEIIWHQQQLGKIGQVATANLAVDGCDIYTTNHLSDLVQRVSRRREFKTKVENRLKGWHIMLLNSILSFAVENGFKRIYSPTADFVVELSDPKRRHTLRRNLFDRVYDRDVEMLFSAKRQDQWWLIDVDENIGKLVVPEKKTEVIDNKEKTICLFHDTERGLGHLGIDPDLVEFASQFAPKALEEMLIIEKEMEVKATYNIVGSFLDEIRERIEHDGHCTAFHSYDHQIDKKNPAAEGHDSVTGYRLIANLRNKMVNRVHGKLLPQTLQAPIKQLDECRRIDYRIKGFRPPQSVITPEYNDVNLCYHNFEWLAGDPRSLNTRRSKLENRIVKIPLTFDDYAMYKHKLSYDEWERIAIDKIEQNEFVAFGLHDCYAQYWLPHYRTFLERIRSLGVFKTLNEVADEVFLASTS